MPHVFDLRFRILECTKLPEVVLSVFTGVGGWGWSRASSPRRIGIISWPFPKRPPVSDSAAEATAFRMVLQMTSTAPLSVVVLLSFENQDSSIQRIGFERWVGPSTLHRSLHEVSCRWHKNEFWDWDMLSHNLVSCRNHLEFFLLL